MTPEVSDFLPDLLEDMNKHIEIAGGHHVTEKKKDKYEKKCATITEICSSQHYTMYFRHQIYTTGYFLSIVQ